MRFPRNISLRVDWRSRWGLIIAINVGDTLLGIQVGPVLFRIETGW